VHGIRVLDLTRVLAGPWATQQLADQGALVVKVEPPGGDETRGFGPYAQGADGKAHSTYFLGANRNKRSIVLDLRTGAGKQVLGDLIARADVLVENFRPGVAERLGFGWPLVHRANPRLVYVAIHAFGEHGEWAARPGYDLALQALGGAMAATGFPGSPPTKHPASVADLLSGLYCAQAVLLGLLERERTGRTQKIVVDMMAAQAAALTYQATRHTVLGETEEQRGNAHRGLAPYDVYRCRDGWIALACGNDPIWARLRVVLDLPDLPEWRRNADRLQHREALNAAVGEKLASMTVAEADALLAGAEVPSGPVLTLDRTLTHPAVELVAAEHAALGTVRMPGPPLRTLTTRHDHDAPPLLGQHRDAILAELGYDEAARIALAEAGAFGK
jgi:crotonobetainyl-CoA:carnitine CoA-transferase CaiB-like acyl-CoA transferase